jgi:cellulose synthase/poly-beta-1,6-N-acetylglucosamine synthase-like glycosyltransferase
MSATFLRAVLWTGVGTTLYAYFVFPLVVALLARLTRRRSGPRASAEHGAKVTVIIPAYNEEANIGAKISNTLSSDYPRHLLDVIVVSDASTDRTDDIVRSFDHEGVRLLVQERRRGKTAGLNRAVASASGEILVFTDANAAYAPDTIATLAGSLGDPAVGLVTGFTRYRLTARGDVAEVTNVYTSLERVIKRAEGVWGCCVGADGAIFAMRRSLYQPLKDDDINDFVLPLGVIDQGFRCVFAEDAFCSEHAGQNLDSEFRRQSRITNRTLRALWRNVHLLNPIRFPAFSYFIFSHKVARFLAPVAMALSAVALVLLARSGDPFTAAVLGALFIGVAAAAASPLVPPRFAVGRLLRMVNAFVLINIAVLDGWRKFLTGEGDVTWQPDRASVNRPAER